MPELFRIINGALRLDVDKVRNYTAFLAEKLQNAGDEASAGRLRKMLEETDHQLRPAGATFSKVLPVDLVIRGCPPTPTDLLQGLLWLISDSAARVATDASRP